MLNFNENDLLLNIEKHSGLGMALCDADTLSLNYKNELFCNWFSNNNSSTLISDFIPDLPIEKLLKRLNGGREYTYECELKIGGRSKILKSKFTLIENNQILIISTNYTKEKEQEYLLESYVRMAEKNKAMLESSLSIIQNQKEELMVINDNLEKERNSIELRALQAIINPHFVSNCLASIQRFLIDNDSENSVNYLSFFGKLMRLSFEQSYSDYVPICDIISMLNTYVEIEKMRIDHSWEFNLIVDPKLNIENSKIPPLLIQPFLENAIWYGVNKTEEYGKITIELEQIDSVTMKCSIEDNGPGRLGKLKKENEKKTTLHSLNVTNKRLNILWKEHDRNYEIEYIDLLNADGSAGGTRVELFIPINF